VSKSDQTPREAHARTPLDSGGSQVPSRRRFLTSSLAAIGTSAALPLLLDACSSAGGGGSQTGNGSASNPVTLQFWTSFDTPDFTKALNAAIGTFQRQHPSIRIQTNIQPGTALRQKLIPLLTDGGATIDIIMDSSSEASTYADLPYGYIDLTQQVSSADLKSKILAGSWAPMTVNNQIHAVPFAAYVFFLIYNPKLFSQAGANAVPSSWDGLQQTLSKISQLSKDTFGFLTLTSTFISWPLEVLWYDSGVGYFQGSENFTNYNTKNKLTIATPAAVQALEYLKSLAATAPGGLPGNISITTDNQNAAFAKGNLGAIYSSLDELVTIVTDNPSLKPQVDYNLVPFPKGSLRRGVSYSTQALGVPKLSQHPDEAWQFIEFLSSQEGLIAPTLGGVPLRTGGQFVPSGPVAAVLPIARKALLGLDDASPYPQAYFPQLDSIRTPLSQNVQAFFLGQKTALQALQATENAAEASME
jgi:multiple sugar transport system substrate-binding protein